MRASFAAVLPFVLLAGCDIVQGFQHAGDALFPPVKTYLDAPGYRIVTGGYRELTFVTGGELYLLARGASPEDTSLYAMRYANPAPCAIPNAVRYAAYGDVNAEVTWIGHFEQNVGRGPLFFSDMYCRPSALTLPDAELPFALRSWLAPDGSLDVESARTLILRSGNQLLAVDPGEPSVETLLEPAGQVLAGIGALGVSYVVSEGRLAAFDSRWKFIQWVGNNVVGVGSLGGRLYIEDAGGIHRISSVPQGSETGLSITELAADGCAMSFPSATQRWIAYYSPCSEQRLVVYNEDVSLAAPLELATDPRLLLLFSDPKPQSTSEPPTALERLFAFYLRDVDYQAGVGTLVLRARGGEEVVLGARAVLERTTVDAEGQFGFALLDFEGETGRFVRWELDGTVTPLAERTLREPAAPSWAKLIVDWDGTVGTLAQTANGEVRRVLERVPSRRYAYDDGKYVALFHDFDGQVGTLSLGTQVCPPEPESCANRYYSPSPVARGVRNGRHRLMSDNGAFLPGLAFITNYDARTDTGRFEYRNLELGFTSIVNDGVSDFLMAGNGVLYAVPFGEGAGIWLARAK